MPIGPFKDFDACLVGLKDKYPSDEQRRKVCGAMKARLEAKPLREGVRVTGTTKPGGTDGHVHDFTAEVYQSQYPGPDGEEQKAKVMFWSSPAYVPGVHVVSSWEPGAPQTLGVSHWHEWESTQRTAEALGHSHDLPDLPDLAAEDLEAVARSEGDVPTSSAVVEEGPGYWLVRNVVATRVGVSVGQKVLKRREAIRQTADLLDGAPIVYGFDAHYKPNGLEPDPLQAPGYAVNGRLEGDAALYDAILWQKNPAGYTVPDADLAMNAAFVAAVRDGKHVHNSVGSLGVERMEAGTATPMGGGAPVPYASEQVRVLKVGHVAILGPVASGRGSCPAPACGAIPQEATALAEALGVRPDAVLIAAGMASRRAK